MIKFLKKIRDVLYSISYTFESLAEKVDSAIWEREKPESSMSSQMRTFYDEMLIKNASANFESLFPKSSEEQKGKKIKWRKYSSLEEGEKYIYDMTGEILPK